MIQGEMETVFSYDFMTMIMLFILYRACFYILCMFLFLSDSRFIEAKVLSTVANTNRIYLICIVSSLQAVEYILVWQSVPS